MASKNDRKDNHWGVFSVNGIIVLDISAFYFTVLNILLLWQANIFTKTCSTTAGIIRGGHGVLLLQNTVNQVKVLTQVTVKMFWVIFFFPKNKTK